MLGRFLFVAFVIGCAFAHTTEEWKKRTVYQLLTDRFNGGSGYDLSNYCGGTFNGLADRLDYIAGMGFDAIWITPVIENTPGGYHGYWAKNLYAINAHFGSERDLESLVEKAHAKGMWVMLDVVANHMGQGEISTYVPFNDWNAHYHSCDGCPPSCAIEDWNNQWQIEHCQLANLPDLKQEDGYVDNELKKWISWIVKRFGFDGLRIDTIMEVDKTWWTGFCEASGVYCVGEAENGDVSRVSIYQQYLPGVLSYPLYYTMKGVFGYGNSMYDLRSANENLDKMFKDRYALGTFIDNHDQQRFLCYNNNWNLYKNALVYTLMSTGIPIIYYGSEQGFGGCNDPQNREVMWNSFDVNHELYKFIRTTISARKDNNIFTEKQVERFVDDHFFAFSRGKVLVAVTNSKHETTETLNYHPYSEGQTVCNVFDRSDCLTVTSGKLTITLRALPKIYVPN